VALGSGQDQAADMRLGWPLALVLLPLILAGLALAWLPFMPNSLGLIGADYSVWLPNLLAGFFWHVQNGWFSVPWFNPAQCGGIPVQADPQGEFFSLPQFLTFFIPPLRALQVSFFAFAAAGYLGCFWLARGRFLLSMPAAVLAAVLFVFNSFYAARMVVGHVTFSPFMLVPASACCLIGRGRGLSGWVFRCCGFALLLGAMLEGGMLVLILPAYLSLLIVLALHTLVTGRFSITPLLRLAAGTALGLVICAGKLAAVLSLMAHVPRDAYPLPGYANPALAFWFCVRALFVGPADAMRTQLQNGIIQFERHEFEYSIGPAALVLMLCAGTMALRQRPLPRQGQLAGLTVLLVLLAMPVALNTHGAAWTAFLKMLPVIRNSSSLLRWFAAPMLPAVLGAGLALDWLVAARLVRPWPITAAATTATLAALLLADRTPYGPAESGIYDPRPIEASWHTVAATRAVPPVTEIAVLRDKDGRVDRGSTTRQDGMAVGQSQLFCYDPLFGYGLENFPQGALHPGPVFEQRDGQLNIKNPACYVFPGANDCRPGDAFAVGAIDQAARFVSYRPFEWRKPVWAVAADWAGIVGWPMIVLALCGGLLHRRLTRSGT